MTLPAHLLTPESTRGLTLWQPWARLIACGAKRIETRSWSTAWRELLLIHASKPVGGWKRQAIGVSKAWEHLRAAGDGRMYEELPSGCVVAVARVSCVALMLDGGRVTVTSNGMPVPWQPSERDRECGDFRAERFAWYLEDVVALRTPIPARGGFRLWRVSDDLIGRVRESLITDGKIPRARRELVDLSDRIAP